MSEKEFYIFITDLSAGLSTEKAEALHNEKLKVATAMRQHGGSFVSQLGATLFLADIPNTLKIKHAFSSYWETYAEMAKLHAAREEE